MRQRHVVTVILLVFLLLIGACVAPAAPASEPAATAAPAAESAAPALKLAAIFPGPISDADYNTLGYNGIKAVEARGVQIAYSEAVAVPDVDRVMREYIDDGFNIIFAHGSQFANQTIALAAEFPDLYFIAELDAPVENAPANLWVIDRNFHLGFYGVGALAARATSSGKIGYIGGLTLPFSNAEVHAMQQAITDAGVEVTLNPVWAGDFNDPSKARELAAAMLADDVDVIVGSLNAGMFGIFEAAKSSDKPVTVIAKYTDKSSFAPDHYITSLLYDFEGPLTAIVGKIQAGESGGYYPLGFDTGVALQLPLQHVSAEVATAVEGILADLQSGAITVEKNTDPIE
jgi:basic membrane protein A